MEGKIEALVKWGDTASKAGEFDKAHHYYSMALEISQNNNSIRREKETVAQKVNKPRDSGDTVNGNKKRKIFISYARDDYIVASNLYRFLKENGFNPWMDKFDLVPGQNWELEIQRGIKSCDYFIACLSKNSVSKRGYVQKELKQALSILEQFPEGDIYLIPIRIDNCTVPESLSTRQWLDWSNKNARLQLLAALQRGQSK